jgi:LmbE family N-acetylglucosaminyl deacetylase
MLRPSGKTLNIVAHADDDLLFLSPDLLHSIQAGRAVRTVFLTAGDGGAEADYWQGREVGIQAAYAQMCGVPDAWTRTDFGLIGHPIPVFTLAGCATVSLVFLRLPDGNIDGNGFAATHYKSLQQLWTGAISTIATLDGVASYSKATLLDTLGACMSSFQPDQINTQDYVGSYDDGDHSDHHAVAYLVQAAAHLYTSPHRVTGYLGYTTSTQLANVSGADLSAKQDAFYAYAQHDRAVGGLPDIFPETWKMNIRLRRLIFLLRSWRSRARYGLTSLAHKRTASSADTTFMPWLQRQYTVDARSRENHPRQVATASSEQRGP